MYSTFIHLLSFLPLVLAAPIEDPLERMRTENRLIGRKANDSMPSVEAILAHYEKQVAYYAGDNGLEKRQAARKGRAFGVPYDSDALDYSWNIKVGKDNMKVHFSTEWSDFFLYSTKLPAAQQAGHSLYHFGGKRKQGYTFNINRGAGVTAMSGDVWTDKVTIGGYTATQEIEPMTSASAGVLSDTAEYDGVVGWGWPTGKTGCFPRDCQPWWSTVSETFPNTVAGFSVAYQDTKAIWDQGFVDSAMYTGEMFYTQGYYRRTGWDFLTDGLSVGSGAPMKQYYGRQLLSTVHTDLIFILANTDIRNDYYKKVKGAKADAALGGLYSFPCSSTLPDYNFYISDVGENRQVKRVIPGKRMSLGQYDAAKNLCIGAIQEFQHELLDIAFGVPFLKAQYVNFSNNVDQFFSPTIGFAQQK